MLRAMLTVTVVEAESLTFPCVNMSSYHYRVTEIFFVVPSAWRTSIVILFPKAESQNPLEVFIGDCSGSDV